jgi:mono/diheme cytochrome c family protein
MKLTTALSLSLMLLLSTTSWAKTGASLYKSKCAGCHGANGEGKPATKAPALKGISLDASQIAERLTKGFPDSKAPHNKAMHGIKADQATSIAEYVKTLQ